MKKAFIIGGLIMLATAVQAEVKPKGTILNDACGHLNKSFQLCTAQAVGSENVYLVLTGFGMRQSRLGGEYFKASLKVKDIGGAEEKIYTAIVPVQVGNYVVEKKYELKLLQGDDVEAIASLYIDGKLSDGEIIMEPVYYTESL